MSITVQHRRDTRAVLEAATPAEGEIGYDKDLKAIRTGDGATLGGSLHKLWGKSYVLSPAQIAGNQNDYNPADLKIAETIIVDLSANWTMTGLAGGATNREVKIYNGSAFRLTLTNEDAGSAAANRFHINANLVVRPFQGVHLIYSAVLSRWLIVGRADLGITDLPEGVTLSGECRPNQIAAAQNDWDPADATSALAWSASRASAIYVSSDASRRITGLAGGVKGRLVHIVNSGGNPIVLGAADTGSVAANRFDMSVDVTLQGKQVAILQYDATAARWKMLANTAGASVAAGGVTAVSLAQSAIAHGPLVNGYLEWTVAGSALTIALKTLAGADPSAADPVYVWVRNAAAAPAAGTPTYTLMTITAALSLVVSNGSSLGLTVNSQAFRLWAVLFNDAGTARIGVINCLSGLDIYRLAGWGIASSTAEGGAGAADNAQTFYTGAAVAAKPYSVLGYASWETGLAAVSVWSAAPTREQVYIVGVPLPGDVLQEREDATTTPASGTTALPFDATTPQNTEGDQYHSKAITPSSAANILAIEHTGSGVHSASAGIITALFQDANVNALASNVVFGNGVGTVPSLLKLTHRMLAGTSVSTTFKLRAGGNAGATFYYLQTSGVTPLLGSGVTGRLLIKEIMT